MPGHATTLPGALAIHGEGIEEQGRSDGLGLVLEEVVLRGTGGEVTRETTWQRTHDHRGVEMTGVVGHHDHRWTGTIEPISVVHGDIGHRPHETLHQPLLGHEAGRGEGARCVAARFVHGVRLSLGADRVLVSRTLSGSEVSVSGGIMMSLTLGGEFAGDRADGAAGRDAGERHRDLPRHRRH